MWLWQHAWCINQSKQCFFFNEFYLVFWDYPVILIYSLPSLCRFKTGHQTNVSSNHHASITAPENLSAGGKLLLHLWMYERFHRNHSFEKIKQVKWIITMGSAYQDNTEHDHVYYMSGVSMYVPFACILHTVVIVVAIVESSPSSARARAEEGEDCSEWLSTFVASLPALTIDVNRCCTHIDLGIWQHIHVQTPFCTLYSTVTKIL